MATLANLGMTQINSELVKAKDCRRAFRAALIPIRTDLEMTLVPPLRRRRASLILLCFWAGTTEQMIRTILSEPEEVSPRQRSQPRLSSRHRRERGSVATLLRDLQIFEVSSVDKAANKHARVLFWKRDNTRRPAELEKSSREEILKMCATDVVTNKPVLGNSLITSQRRNAATINHRNRHLLAS